MRSSVKRALRQFARTTTLHGFKYLCSLFCLDRVGWVACCCASACCAGMLCGVLWARFLQVPALLVLANTRHDAHQLPHVSVCPSPGRAAQLFAKHMSVSAQEALRLPSLFHNLMHGKPVPSDHLGVLKRLLKAHDMTFPEALFNITPPCVDMIRKCRWRDTMVPCGQLFQKELTSWGVCCMAKGEKFSKSDEVVYDPKLDLVLECADSEFTIPNSCEFYTKYHGEEWMSPVTLTTGYRFLVQLRYTAIQDANADKLVESKCESRVGYSRRRCMIECKELKCGCSDPLRTFQPYETTVPPPCPISKLNCLRNVKNIDDICPCRESCRRIQAITSVESAPMNEMQHTFDSIYAGLNTRVTTVVAFHMMHSDSKTFDLMYNETWWSLLSSLGGVFNMFLGVGLFSALELLFFFIIKLPAAIRQSTEINLPTAR
ncbi:sodium channel protein Nach-like [Pectinophora gossypiella]|uniref:sodium channel protein Nach-like n=1 Tax=Pectinophora gossypiella TaxID=13191 RepID=UPI00214ED8D9|nr:sodium channel protein Nach-like [Pectinophora gossypiella]